MEPSTDNHFEHFTTLVASIPVGRYTSYGELARLCGVHVRQVQAWLRRFPNGTKLPWHRIVNSQRKITAHASAHIQAQRLLAENIIPDANIQRPLKSLLPSILLGP